jgi:hypothetical protein
MSFTLGKPPVVKRLGLTYGLFLETVGFVASSTLIVSVVGVVVSAVLVAVALVNGGVVG